jgi:carbon monoxide dehydrogenase subunit G
LDQVTEVNQSLMFEGTYELTVDQKTIWNFIIDPARIGKCLPDLKSLEVESENESIAIIRVGVGPIRTDFKFRIETVEKQPNSHLRLKSAGTGSGSSINLDVVIDLRERLGGCTLFYKSDVKVGGIMAGLGQRLMKDTADKTIAGIFECIRKQVA